MPLAPVSEDLSSYEFSRPTLSASRSSVTNSISPGTSLRHVNPQLVIRARPPLASRSTYDGIPREQTRVTSEVRNTRIIDLSDELVAPNGPHSQTHDVRDHEPFGNTSRVVALHLKKRDENKSDEGLQRSIPSASPRLGSEPISSIPGTSKNARPKWARSQSGSIWIRRQRAALDSESSASAKSTPERSEIGNPAGVVIMPLVPPTPPSRPELAPSRDSGVQVETPFPGTQDIARLAKRHSTGGSLNSLSHRASLDTSRLLLAPLSALKRFIKEKHSVSDTPPAEHHQASLSTSHVQGHKSGLRQYQTALILDRVTSILESNKGTKSKGRFHAWAAKSASTTSSSEPNEPRHNQQHKGIAATFNLSKDKSLEDIQRSKTVSSSILDLHRGSTPQNSPQEIATYKIKRSSSAETEEFLKIDISIRGGTSYLPSEARRIHTPPLPDDDGGRGSPKRGFFFDYNLPDMSNNPSPFQSQLNTPAATPGISSSISHNATDYFDMGSCDSWSLRSKEVAI